ncbi:MAG: uncharacterized protein QOD06_72 [Candidatus Binatota bacterium]|nr:uncharacterized protein [Candidatus Binatota bacterium]
MTGISPRPCDAPDPRPRLIAHGDGSSRIEGVRCTECRLPVAFARLRCPACGAAVAGDLFGPLGTVWSSTVVRIPVPGRTPPYALAYVDLDDGPRILAHAARQADAPLRIGTRVRLTGISAGGDLVVEEDP